MEFPSYPYIKKKNLHGLPHWNMEEPGAWYMPRTGCHVGGLTWAHLILIVRVGKGGFDPGIPLKRKEITRQLLDWVLAAVTALD